MSDAWLAQQGEVTTQPVISSGARNDLGLELRFFAGLPGSMRLRRALA